MLEIFSDPAAWAALVTLIVMEVVLGIDNLLFISIITNKLPEADRARARRIGIGGALVLRLLLLGTIAWIVQLKEPLFSAFGEDFSIKDLILIAGGFFLLWKATKEIHHYVDPEPTHDVLTGKTATLTVSAAVVQVLLLDLVFSIDSILTAVGMTPHVPIMVIAVVFAVTVMLIAATPLANFVSKNPTVVMLALAFLFMIGTVLVAEGLGFHVPKGYIYTAMAFSAAVEAANLIARRRRQSLREAASDGAP